MISFKDFLLAKQMGGGGKGSAVIKPITITKNGIYEAKAGGVTGPITWDGVVGDREIAGDPSSGAYHVKVSNEFLTKEDMIGGRFSISTSEQDDEIPENYCFSLSDMSSGDYGDSWLLGEGNVVFADREFVFNNMSFTKGIYFVTMPSNGIYMSSITPNQAYLDSAQTIDGYSPITVNVQSGGSGGDMELAPFIVYQNGTYKASDICKYNIIDKNLSDIDWSQYLTDLHLEEWWADVGRGRLEDGSTMDIGIYLIEQDGTLFKTVNMYGDTPDGEYFDLYYPDATGLEVWGKTENGWYTYD